MKSNSVGWGIPDKESIKNALFSVCLEKDNKIIGCGRVIGDGGIYFYIQDVIVLPEHQRKGYGKIIMKEVMNYINQKAKRGSFIGLFSAKGFEGFYSKFGFIERPDKKFGPGMFLIIK